ncbi:nucleotide exchange factor GrpE [Candidatus Parcubacteria bacterium]|nr:nucleotide exchange factor GrpE [Candidatus Parcubacteria bacterium]
MNGTDEEFVPEEESESGEGTVKRLREKLKKAVEEKQEYLDGWQRARADFANYKREEANLHTDKEARIKAEFVESLLPALDSFEMALKHNPTEELTLVHKQLLSALTELGVEQFGKVGEDFSPHLHEALAKQEDGEKIVRVERSGYKINNTIIRPAQVII